MSEFHRTSGSSLYLGEWGFGLDCVVGLREPQWEGLLSEILPYPPGPVLAVITICTCYLHILQTCFLLPMMVRHDVPNGIQFYIAITQPEVWPTASIFSV